METKIVPAGGRKRLGIAEIARVIKYVVRVASGWCCMKADFTEILTLDTAQASIFEWPVMVLGVL